MAIRSAVGPVSGTGAEPDLSLVVPCYREASHLRASVATLLELLEMTRLHYEVVFVDDASPDDTFSILEALCIQHPQCRSLRHETNRGRGAAFKTGFAATKGRVTGFIDIDLEVGPHYIPAMVNLIEKHGYDVVTGRRYYAWNQTGLFRHLMSQTYRLLVRRALGLGVTDSETGYKFFQRERAGSTVLGSKHDRWFWDTEVMARAALQNLRICELPVLFFRRYDKRSTVRVVPDAVRHLAALRQFRREIGLAYLDKSPIYWTPSFYDLAMRLLMRRDYSRIFEDVAALIPPGASVTEVCCGTCALYRRHLRDKACRYVGLDFNTRFILGARRQGIDARFVDSLSADLPPADYVVMCSSLYHFQRCADEVLARLKRAAGRAVIVSEPVRNLSTHTNPLLARLARALTNPGVGDYRERFSLQQFRAFAEVNGASEFRYEAGRRNAIALFRAS
jgi:glycosyltransferase involved in cell wall biosynthesis